MCSPADTSIGVHPLVQAWGVEVPPHHRHAQVTLAWPGEPSEKVGLLFIGEGFTQYAINAINGARGGERNTFI